VGWWWGEQQVTHCCAINTAHRLQSSAVRGHAAAYAWFGCYPDTTTMGFAASPAGHTELYVATVYISSPVQMELLQRDAEDMSLSAQRVELPQSVPGKVWVACELQARLDWDARFHTHVDCFAAHAQLQVQSRRGPDGHVDRTPHGAVTAIAFAAGVSRTYLVELQTGSVLLQRGFSAFRTAPSLSRFLQKLLT
jgi:hypothetical protein